MKTVKPEQSGTLPRPPFSLPRIVDLLILSALFIALAYWSWGRWADLLVDFGHELYIPWQLAEGKVLQRDVATIYGPLSQYFNALIFLLFGPSLRLLTLVNMILLAAMVFLLYRLVEAIADRLTALTAAVVFLALFSFSQYQGIANYNFICPFTHESSHGLLLALLMLNCLQGYLRDRRRGAAMGAGFAFGLIFLTRAEITFAALAAAGALFATLLITDRENRPGTARAIALFCSTALLPPSLFLIYFTTQMPLLPAFQAVIGSWNTLFASSVAESPFYQVAMGINRPLANSVRMLITAAITAGVGAAAFFLSRFLPARRQVHLFAGFCAVVFLVLFSSRIPLGALSWGLPLICAAAAIHSFMAALKRNCPPQDQAGAILMLAFTLFALALLAKVVLNVRFAHYGFYLASSATTVLVIILVRLVPKRLGRRGLFFRLFSLGLLLALTVSHLQVSNRWYKIKNYPVGKAPDSIVHYDPEQTGTGTIVRSALKWMKMNLHPDATLMALPQGVMLNYLSRRENPSPYIQISMTEILLFGESRILKSIQEKRPDYIAMVHVESGEFGVSYFGVDFRFGARIMQWVRENYTEMVIFGDRPLLHPGFGIMILERNREVSTP